MAHIRNTIVLVCTAVGLALGASATETAYDSLPDGAPREIAQLFHSALDVPDIAGWPAQDRKDLLNVVTHRYKNRLIDRAPAASLPHVERYVERLAQSALAREFPNAMRQTCAQYGLTGESCAMHSGYVRRALVLEEMLARRHLTLDQLETELAGATRRNLSGWQRAHPE